MSLQKRYRLAKRADFSRIYRVGKSAANMQFVVYHKTNKQTERFRVGVSASKKLGGAVVRNRVRRLVKEAVRLNADKIASNRDIIVIVRRPVIDLRFKEVEKSLLHAFRRAGVLEKS